MLDELGGTFVDAQSSADIREELSAEMIGELFGDAERILLITALDPDADLAELNADVLWSGLPAVQGRAPWRPRRSRPTGAGPTACDGVTTSARSPSSETSRRINPFRHDGRLGDHESEQR